MYLEVHADEDLRWRSSTARTEADRNTFRGVPSLLRSGRCTQCESTLATTDGPVRVGNRFAEGPINPKPSPYNGHYLHSSRDRHHHIPEVTRGDPLVTNPSRLSDLIWKTGGRGRQERNR